MGCVVRCWQGRTQRHVLRAEVSLSGCPRVTAPRPPGAGRAASTGCDGGSCRCRRKGCSTSKPVSALTSMDRERPPEESLALK